MSRIKIYLKIALYCLRSTHQLNLGDRVTYQGQRWILVQGVNRPLWNLARPHGNEGYIQDVHESAFRKERSLGNFFHDLRSTYRFYRGYWFDIWLRGLSGDKSSMDCISRNMPVR